MKIKQLFKPQYLFYVSFISYMVIFLLNNDAFNYIPKLFRVWGGFFVAGSFVLLYFQALIETSKNKQWLHFWLTLLTIFYVWIYYIFFYKKGFNLAKKIREFRK